METSKEQEKSKATQQIVQKKKMSTTKKLILFLFINCTIIEIFTGIVTLQNLYLAYKVGVSIDFSPLVTLIGAVVGEVMGFAVYAAKSAKENCENGIVYMTTKHELENREAEI